MVCILYLASSHLNQTMFTISAFLCFNLLLCGCFAPYEETSSTFDEFVIITEEEDNTSSYNESWPSTDLWSPESDLDKDDIEQDGEKCPPHSILTCPTRCDLTCKKPLSLDEECPTPTSCPKMACTCTAGFVFDPTSSRCILSQYCPEKCVKDEVWELCPTACPLDCSNFELALDGCKEDTRDDYECEALCVCREGFIRDLISKQCVEKDKCSEIMESPKNRPYPCPPNEHYETCGTSCPTYCHNQGSIYVSRLKCVLGSCRAGCFCDAGFVRLNWNSKCIRQDDCYVMLKYGDIEN